MEKDKIKVGTIPHPTLFVGVVRRAKNVILRGIGRIGIYLIRFIVYCVVVYVVLCVYVYVVYGYVLIVW